MKKISLLLSLALILSLLGGCAGQASQEQYSLTYLDLFDTVTTITGRAESQAVFQENARGIYEELLRYHQLFDIYHDYDGINNLKTVNDHAGIGPVEVDKAIIELLLDCKAYESLTGGRVNVAMGSVLRLWHEARNQSLEDPANAFLPEAAALEKAGEHRNLDTVVIDVAASTVFITDPEVRLDVGAIAKGWAAGKAAEHAPGQLLLSVGGNICPTGPKDDAGTPWVVGIQNPDGGSDYLHTLYVTEMCIVTSGDYQRCFAVDGKIYHHIIDPDTLYPSEYWRSVTVACSDSGLADALSTALFLLPLEEGQALLAQCGAEGMWVNADGEKFYSSGFEAMIRS